MRLSSVLTLAVFPLAFAGAVATTACGEDSRTLPPSGNAGSAGTQAQGGSSSGGSSAGGASSGGSAGSGASVPLCAGATAPTNAEICPAGTPHAPDCAQTTSKPIQSCGVLARVEPDKTVDSKRTTDTEEYAAAGDVDTKCFEKANWKAAGTPKNVTLFGFVRNFSNGCDAKNVKIEVFTVKRGGAEDGSPDQLIGTAVTTGSGACEEGQADCKLVEVEDKCPNKRIWRAYEYPNVPTETELLIRTSSVDGANDYAPLYDFNIYVSNDDPGVAEGKYERPLRAIVNSDFSLIPQVAYGSPITPGNGAVAGEIHDCGDIRITNATFGVSRKGAAESYFSDNEQAPLPDGQATSTSVLGLYSAYDLTPGPVRVVALARVGGQQTSLGYYDVRIFPNAISSMTFRGLRPFQAAAAGK